MKTIRHLVGHAMFLLVAFQASAQTSSVYERILIFPANYNLGDYIEFLKVSPVSSGASGYYEISISYTRGNIAAAATYIASISHSNPDGWKEVGRVNSNSYVPEANGSNGHNLTIDCNPASGNVRFRIRAVRTLGLVDKVLIVYVKVRSINQNSAWAELDLAGNDLSVNKMLPMTTDWSLYVGNQRSTAGANLAIKATINGNVGIGIANPDAKLAVNGVVHSREVKVDLNGWSDFVFEEGYALPTLGEVERHIREKGHLKGIPSAGEVKENGIFLGEMNARLLQKIEELTLYVIQQQKQIEELLEHSRRQQLEIEQLKKK